MRVYIPDQDEAIAELIEEFDDARFDLEIVHLDQVDRWTYVCNGVFLVSGDFLRHHHDEIRFARERKLQNVLVLVMLSRSELLSFAHLLGSADGWLFRGSTADVFWSSLKVSLHGYAVMPSEAARGRPRPGCFYRSCRRRLDPDASRMSLPARTRKRNQRQADLCTAANLGRDLQTNLPIVTSEARCLQQSGGRSIGQAIRDRDH